MQQATRPIAHTPPAGNVFAPPPASPRFVVNLCSSTTPVALVQPNHAGLKRFTFFVSRRLEEGRERFRLHMGYFESQEEAETMLDLVRDVYPAAWAGVAPGIKLRARAAQVASEAARAEAPRAAEPPAAPSPASTPEPVAVPAAVSAPAASAPVVASAPAFESAPAVAGAPAVASAPTIVSVPAAPSVESASVQIELAPDLPRDQAAHASAQANAEVDDATRSLVDVRAAIESLGDTTPQANGAVLEGAAVLQLLSSAHPAPAARVAPTAPALPPQAPPRESAKPASPERRSWTSAATKASPSSQASARAEAAARAEPALFAVQLLWSVQPIDIGQVPMLAIFSAYTLYGAEGNRDGRRWFGLRLGFFTDAVSAKQVAQYVRSEFKSVSVVPVSERERGRANAATAKPLPQNAQPVDASPELNFIDDVPTDMADSGSMPAMVEPPTVTVRAADSHASQAAMAAVGLGPRPAPGKRAKARATPAPKPAGKRSRPLSLEETLEILGAGDLSLEKSRKELINDPSRGDRKPSTPNSSKFGRLINRLAERFGNV